MKSLYRVGKRSLLGLVVAGMLSACATTAEDKSQVMSAEQYLQRGQAQLKAGNVSGAEMTLDEMELHYPVNVETADLHMGLLHNYYNSHQDETTVLSAQRFVNMFPAYADVDFAYYAGGMGNFQRGLQWLEPSDGRTPNPEYAREGLKSFKGLEKCCASSQYLPDARERVAELTEAIAMYEVRLMEDEFRSGDAEAGTDRGWYIVSNYPDTEASKRALAILSGDAAVGTEIATPVAVEEPAPVMVAEPEPAPMAEPEPEPLPAPALVNYVIQVACYKELTGLNRALADMGLADQVAIERRHVMGEDLYSAVYGGYANEADAQEDMARLKGEFGVSDLWLRKASLSEPLN